MKESLINICKGSFDSRVLLAGLILLAAFIVDAQNVRKPDYKADQALKGNARVNPSTRAMELSIPIGGYQGRGGSGLPIVFNYSSKVWQMYAPPASSWQEQYGTIITDTQPLYARRSAAGWTSNLGVPRIDYELGIFEAFHEGSSYEGQAFSPYIPYGSGTGPNYFLYYIKRVQVTMPDGSSHEFRKDDTINSYGTMNSPGGPGLPEMTGTFLSVDGSKMRLDLGESQSTLFMPDGSRYLFGQNAQQASTFVDRNGNKMTFNTSTRQWTDTMGRTVTDPVPLNWYPFEQSQTVGIQTAQFPSKDGSTFNVNFTWRYLKDPGGGESGLENMSQSLNYTSDKYCQGNLEHNVPGPYLFQNLEISITRVCAPGYSSADPPFNPIVLTKIALPNGQAYEFKYNVYGEISKIIYPTGAYERFTYAQAGTVQPQDVSYDQGNRGVAERWVSPKGDGTDELHWTYADGTVTNPDLTRTVQTLYTESIGTPQPYGFGNAKSGRPYEEKTYAPGSPGQLLRRKLTGYTWTGPQSGGYAEATRDLRPNKEVSIIFEPGESYALAQMTETIYDTNNDPAYFAELNPKQVKTYHYIVLDLTAAQTASIDTISALFTSANLATVSEMDYLYDPNYKARNINGLATETRIKDASGNIKAKSQIGYDGESLLTDVSSTRWENPNSNYRGLVTSTRSWSDIAANQFVETRAQYDLLGNLRNTWDARNNLTQTEYSSTYDHAYPTRTISPIPGGNGSTTAFETTVIYDFNTGLPTSTTDINGQTATVEYNDALLRPTKVIAPNGHQTITEYGLGTSASTRFVKVRSQIDATNWKEGYQWFDGLGRTIKSQSVDSSGDVFVESQFDTFGRPWKTSNPYRTGETVYWTENFYDTVSRPWKITTPDNAVVETTYDLATSGSHVGTVTTVKDQAGKQRRSITNALGQLIRVDEPDASGNLGSISSPVQPTYYSYDTLSNLITVNQGVQNRSFTYSSLSRLLSATNPESGTINYSYDSNGNLTSKVDARNITTSYSYDALNRVTNRAYTNEPSGSDTPDVSYTYDNATNAKGKLTKVSSSVSTTEYVTFDILGRVTRSKQITDGVTYGDDANPMTYSYNLAGALIEQKYPSGRVVKNVLENDGDLSIVQSKKTANSGFFNYAKHFTYAASGAVTSMQLGNGRWESTQFNSRLQPTQIALGTVQNATDKLDLDYTYGDWNGSSIDATKNNGNIVQQIITVPTVGANSGFTATQKYYYDSLNRIDDSTETIGTTQTWRQDFTYDRYGNRTFNESNTTMPASYANPAITNPTISTTNNRITSSGWTYDAAGNTLTDAGGQIFVYDSDNKQVKASNGSGTLGEYFYDGDGKRVKKVVPASGETTIFVYDGLGKQIAEYSTIVANSTDAKVAYLTNDHLGSPRINTDANGGTVARHDYLPFGEEIATAQRTSTQGYTDDTVRKQFTGYERDNETNLEFAQNRQYGFLHGRFNTSDPAMESANGIDPQSWNRYIYVLNNPLRYVDPLGLWAVGYYTIQDGENKGKRVYVFWKTKEKDDAKSLVKQLGYDPNDKKDKMAQSLLVAVQGSLVTDKQGTFAQLSTVGGKVGGDYGNYLAKVEEKRLAQEEHDKSSAAGKTSGPVDEDYNDCSQTTCRLSFPDQMKGKNKDNFGVLQANVLIRANSNEVTGKKLLSGDIINYGNQHYGKVLFTDDSNVTQVFSRLGVGGAFVVAPINDKKVTSTYGNVTGAFRPK